MQTNILVIKASVYVPAWDPLRQDFSAFHILSNLSQCSLTIDDVIVLTSATLVLPQT